MDRFAPPVTHSRRDRWRRAAWFPIDIPRVALFHMRGPILPRFKEAGLMFHFWVWYGRDTRLFRNLPTKGE